MKRIFILFILCCPWIIKAQDINNYYVNATVTSNGDLLVEEYIETKKEDGYFERNIYYQNEYVNEATEDNILGYTKLNNAKNVEILTVGSVLKKKNSKEKIIGVKEFNKASVGSDGDTGIYLLRNDEGKTYIRIYKTGSDAYYLKYLIKDLAVKYNDISEIYFYFLKNNRDNIKNLHITINLPENKKAYGFSETKKSQKLKNDNYCLEYTYKNVLENEDIKLRVLFDRDLITDSLKESNIEVLSKILNTEKKNGNFINKVDNILEIMILILVIINYMLLVNYTHKGLIDYESLSNLNKKLKNKKNYMYSLIGIFLIIILTFLRLLGIVFLIISIIIASYMISKNKGDDKIKYLGVMYVFIMFICCFNLLINNNVIYIILSIADIISLGNLAIVEKLKKK